MEEVKGGKRLGREFFARDGITVAKELLGKILVHETAVGRIRGVITEVESYMGENDKGSHTYGGKRTARTEPMYHAGGTSYVYLIYGMYSCMNIAAMTEGIPQAVLLRSVVPADEESRKRMIKLRLAGSRRKRDNTADEGGSGNRPGDCGIGEEGIKKADIKKKDEDAERKEAGRIKRIEKNLADGPGKMCLAMGITKADNDIDMVMSDTFYVTEGIAIENSRIQAGKRIGIDYAEEAADYLWRFYVNDVMLFPNGS